MRSEVTAEVLEKVAKLLGGDYCVNNGKLCTIEDSRYRWAYLDVSDGDLLLAILNKAAEMGHSATLNVLGMNPPRWDCQITPAADISEGKSALEATMLAFAQLPESP